MTTATPTIDLLPYDGKRVNLKYVTTADDGSKTEHEIVFNVDTAAPAAIMGKEKGKSSIQMIEARNILGIELAEEKPKNILKKHLKPVELGQARQHLVDRHGYAVNDIAPMAEQKAFDFHAEADHSALGHDHVVKEDATTDDGTDTGVQGSSEEVDF